MVKIAIIGAGFMGQTHAAAYAEMVAQTAVRRRLIKASSGIKIGRAHV